MQISSSPQTAFIPLPTGYPAAQLPASAPEPQNSSLNPVDRVEISDAALQSAAATQVQVNTVTETQTTIKAEECPECAAGTCESCGDKSTRVKNELSDEQQAQVKELKERDAEVRAHEAAHAATGGSFAGSPSYEYQVGPDGKRYAIGGEVKIDTAPIEGDPQATIQKLQQVQAAALAPAEPSDQDRKVAQAAAAALREAQSELAAESRAERTGEAGEGEPVEGAEPLGAAPPADVSPASENDGEASGQDKPFGFDPASASGTGEPSRDDERDSSEARADEVRENGRELNTILQQQIQTAAASYQKIAALA